MPFREEVYAAVDAEREYQGYVHQTPSVRDELIEMDALIMDGITYAGFEDGDKNALRFVRKIAGLAVRCMENHGAPKR